MAKLSDYNSQENDLEDFGSESICSICFSESKGFYSRKNKILYYVCIDNPDHFEKVEFSFE